MDDEAPIARYDPTAGTVRLRLTGGEEVVVGCGLATVQQATGINTVNYYAPTILESTGLGASASLILTVTVGVIAIIGTVIGIILLGFINRRPLIVTGFIGVAAGHAFLAFSFLLPESN